MTQMYELLKSLSTGFVGRCSLLLALVLLAASCGGGAPLPADPGEDDPDVIVADEVLVLDRAARGAVSAFSLDVDADAGLISIDGDSAFAAEAVPGAVLVSEPIPGVAEHGFLLEVVAVTERGGTLDLATRSASLTDVFDHADIELEQEFTPGPDVLLVSEYEGVSLLQAGAGLAPLSGFGFQVDFDETLVSSGEDDENHLRIHGSFAFSAGTAASISIRPSFTRGLKLRNFEFQIWVEESVDLTIEGELELDFDEEKELAAISLGTYTFAVGPVPVVIAPQLVLSVGAEGEVNAHLEFNAERSSRLAFGARFERGAGWSNLSDFSSDFDSPLPQFSADAKADANARMQLNVMFYGVAGPTAFASAFVRGDAEYQRDPFWTMTAGLELGLGVRITLPVLGDLVNHDFAARTFEYSLGESDNQAPTVELLNPADPTTLVEGDDLHLRIMVDDMEQPALIVSVTDETGTERASGSFRSGEETILTVEAACAGTYTVTATDNGGLSASVQHSVVLEPFAPVIHFSTDYYDDNDVYAGDMLPGAALAENRSCGDTGNTADQNLISWFVDDVNVGDTGILTHFLDTGTYGAGQRIELRAEYREGSAGAVSDTVTVELQVLPAELVGILNAVILRPQEGEVLEPVNPAADTFPVQGRAWLTGVDVDLPTGQLSWHRITPDGEELVGTGTSAELHLPCRFDEGPLEISFTAIHDSGTAADSVTFLRPGPCIS